MDLYYPLLPLLQFFHNKKTVLLVVSLHYGGVPVIEKKKNVSTT